MDTLLSVLTGSPYDSSLGATPAGPQEDSGWGTPHVTSTTTVLACAGATAVVAAVAGCVWWMPAKFRARWLFRKAFGSRRHGDASALLEELRINDYDSEVDDDAIADGSGDDEVVFSRATDELGNPSQGRHAGTELTGRKLVAPSRDRHGAGLMANAAVPRLPPTELEVKLQETEAMKAKLELTVIKLSERLRCDRTRSLPVS